MKIIITGISSGIGEAAALFLQSKGYEVIGIDCIKPQILVDWHYVDLENLSQVNTFLETFDIEADAILYAAGIREIRNPIELALHEWQGVFNVNLTSAFLFAQASIRKAIEKKRPLNIIFISSISGLQAEPDRAAYVSSKFALHGLTKQLAFQYGQNQIRVNAIAPGIIETPMTAAYFEDKEQAALIKASTPVGFWGKPQHLMPILDLCLNNDYMNGSILVCDGGFTAGKML